MRRRTQLSLAALVVYATLGTWAEKPFRLQDDVLGFPEYDIQFPDEYVLADDAYSRLRKSPVLRDPKMETSPSSSSDATKPAAELSQQALSNDGPDMGDMGHSSPDIEDSIETYKEMTFGSQRFLCGIPKIQNTDNNSTTAPRDSTGEQEKELTRATSRGLELLKDMQGRCMYYAAGWWSYSFCYMNQVRQFHAIIPDNGAPVYPPTEDPSTQSFVLGRFRQEKKSERKKLQQGRSTDVAIRQSDGESRYLVQYLTDGTPCDLTGRNRKIEIQFHCHPQSTDHIGWIKEVTTCSYLMVVYTPRLCNDVAFQPPREEEPNSIQCREIITPDMVSEWKERQSLHIQQELEDSASEAAPIIGDIEVGAMKLVGKEGKRIEKGRVASMGEEKIEVLLISEDGKIQRMSPDELKKYRIDPEKVESLQKQLEQVANGKDWKMEVVDANGQLSLRGIIIDEEEDDEDAEKKDGKTSPKRHQGDLKAKGNKKHKISERKQGKLNENSMDEESEGSEETYKDEL